MTTRNAVAYAVELSTSERWAAWVARGVQDDRRTRRAATMTVVTLGLGLALWFAILLFGA
jgi:hypothetical protein